MGKKNKDEEVDKGGRPSVVEDEVFREKFLKAIRLGLPYHTCAEFAGCSKTTWYNIKARAERGQELEASFLTEVKKAEATAQLKLITDIQNDTSWQSKAWILERRFPSDYGRIDRMELTGKDGEAVQTENINFTKDMSEISLEDIKRLDAKTLVSLIE